MDSKSLHGNDDSSTPQQASLPRRDAETIEQELRLIRSKLAEPPHPVEYIRESAKQLVSSFAQMVSINTDLLGVRLAPSPEHQPSHAHGLSESSQADFQSRSMPGTPSPPPAPSFALVTAMAWQIAMIFLLWLIGTAPYTIEGLRTILFAITIIHIGAYIVTWQLVQSWIKRAELILRENLLRMECSLARLADAVDERLRRNEPATDAPAEPMDQNSATQANATTEESPVATSRNTKGTPRDRRNKQ